MSRGIIQTKQQRVSALPHYTQDWTQTTQSKQNQLQSSPALSQIFCHTVLKYFPTLHRAGSSKYQPHPTIHKTGHRASSISSSHHQHPHRYPVTQFFTAMTVTTSQSLHRLAGKRPKNSLKKVHGPPKGYCQNHNSTTTQPNQTKQPTNQRKLGFT